MARRCECRALLDTLRHDPRLRLVPLAARAIWLLLADAMMQLPEPGVFRFGSRVGSLKEIAMTVFISGTDDETQLETQLETLIGFGLLLRHEDGAIGLPMPPPADRAAAARQNGGLGGRPKRGETAEQARLRRQGHLPLTIAGGRPESGDSETQETQEKPMDAENPRGGAATAAEEEEARQPREVSLGEQVAELAGLDPAKGLYDFVPLKDWKMRGASDELILATVRKVAARPGYRVPRTLGYFSQAVIEALAAPPPPAPPDPVREAKFAAYNKAMERWRDYGCVGDAPVLERVA